MPLPSGLDYLAPEIPWIHCQHREELPESIAVDRISGSHHQFPTVQGLPLPGMMPKDLSAGVGGFTVWEDRHPIPGEAPGDVNARTSFPGPGPRHEQQHSLTPLPGPHSPGKEYQLGPRLHTRPMLVDTAS